MEGGVWVDIHEASEGIKGALVIPAILKGADHLCDSRKPAITTNEKFSEYNSIYQEIDYIDVYLGTHSRLELSAPISPSESAGQVT